MLVLLLACTQDDGTAEALSDYLAAVDDAETVVTDHAAAVAAATTLDEVLSLEADYGTAWSDAAQVMADAGEMVASCAMDEDDMAAMEAESLAREDMDTAVANHTAEHASHTELSECTASEDSHGAEMNAGMTTLRDAHDTWADSMECSMSGMEM